MVALLFAAIVMVVLTVSGFRLTVDIGEAREIRGSEAPVAGLLGGWNARNSSEWISNPDVRMGGILFGISGASGVGSLEYWKDVAARLWTVAPSAEVVGFCLSREACGDMRGLQARFTVLESMDPAFVHNLTSAAGDGRVLLFRGSQIVGSMPMSENADRFVQQIATQVQNSGTRRGP
jgi:hypothetical protein